MAGTASTTTIVIKVEPREFDLLRSELVTSAERLASEAAASEPRHRAECQEREGQIRNLLAKIG